MEAGSASGYTTGYGLLALTPAGRAAILPNTTNVLAVHCHQTGGGQYIDVGLTIRESTVIDPRPAAATPTGLHGAVGVAGVSLGWDSSPGATSYRVKRATVSGGPYVNVASPPLNAVADSSVAAGATYYYVVAAVNAAGESTPSGEVSFTTPVPPPPELVTWLKADGLDGLANGAAVATWPDVSGHGHDATQGTAERKPSYVTGAINGLPVVRFRAATSNYLSLSRPVEDDFTILCVYRSSQGLGTGTHFYQGAGLVNAEVSAVVNDFGLSLNANGKLLAGTGNPDITVASASGFNDGQPHLITFRRTQRTGQLELYVDGQAQGTATAGRQSLTAPAQLVLGAQQTLINYLDGDIAELKIYSGRLSELERSSEEKTLSCKYGLWAGLPRADCNTNGVPDACEPDVDEDGLIDACDNCPAVANPDQGRHALDLDGDCDIDIEDAEAFALCATGADLPAAGQCLGQDLDGDGDVDQDDFGALQRCLAGPNVAPEPGCAD